MGIQWHNGLNTTTGASGTTIGKGSANTAVIMANQSAVETAYAVGLARAYRGGGFDDLFLPSKDELNQMYIDRANIIIRQFTLCVQFGLFINLSI